MLRVAHDRKIGHDVLADFGWINVDVRDLRLWCIGAHVPRDTVIKAHTNANEKVSRLNCTIHMLPAVHSHVAVGKRIGLINYADTEECPGDGNLCCARQLEQFALCASDQHAVPRQDDRTLRASDRFGEQFDLSWMALKFRLVARKPGLNVGGGWMRRRGLAHQCIFGDVDVHRSWSSTACKMKRFRNGMRNLICGANEIVVLRHWQRDAGDVNLLEGVLADQRIRHVAGDHHNRN